MTCETCLYYVDAMPSTVICIAGKRIKELVHIKRNCRKWVENTPENAGKEIARLEKDLKD